MSKPRLHIQIPTPEANEKYWDLFSDDGIEISVSGVETFEDAEIMYRFLWKVLESYGFEMDGLYYWLRVDRFTWEGSMVDLDDKISYNPEERLLSFFTSGQGVVEDCEEDEQFSEKQIRKVKRRVEYIRAGIKRLFREFTTGEASVFNCIREIRKTIPTHKWRRFVNLIKWDEISTTEKRGKETRIRLTISNIINDKHYWFSLKDYSYWLLSKKYISGKGIIPTKEHRWKITLSMHTPEKEFYNKEFRTMKGFLNLVK